MGFGARLVGAKQESLPCWSLSRNPKEPYDSQLPTHPSQLSAPTPSEREAPWPHGQKEKPRPGDLQMRLLIDAVQGALHLILAGNGTAEKLPGAKLSRALVPTQYVGPFLLPAGCWISLFRAQTNSWLLLKGNQGLVVSDMFCNLPIQECTR